MIYKWGKWLFISLIVLVLSACDSGGSNNAPTIDTNKEKNTTLNGSKVDDTNKTLYRGKFIDSPVGGLSYSVGDVSGVTDKDGYFQYKELNEDIFFYIGKLNIGIAKASANIHISDLKGSLGDYQVDKNARIAQILLSLDIDGNPDNNIQLPDNLEKVFDGNVDFSVTVLSEEDFERSLLRKLEALNIKQMVTIDEAKKHIKETSIELAQFCALPNPKNYNDKGQEILGLSCIDKARLEYFSRIIYPQLASNINAEYAQTVVVEESYNEEAAQRAIDTNPILSSLKVLDSAVDTVDSALKGETLGMYANISTTILKAVQLYVNTTIIFSDKATTTEETAIEFNKQAEFTSLITSTLFNVPSCYSVIKTGKDSGGSCAKAIQDGLDAYKINLELDESLKTIDDEKAKENIDTFINRVAVLSGTIELAKSKNGAEAMSAVFGITDSLLEMTKDAIAISYKSTNNTEVKPEWSPAYISIKVIDSIAQPLARIGKECVKEDILDKFKCYSTISQEIGGLGIKTATGIIGNIQMVRYIENMNAQIVARRVLSEFLFAGSSNYKSVYDKYGVIWGGTQTEQFDRFAELIKNIGKKEFDYNGVSDYFSFGLSQGWNSIKGNPFLISDVRNIYLHNMARVFNEATLDFNSPTIDVVIEETNVVGKRKIKIDIDSDINTYIVCYADWDSSYPSKEPWSGTFEDKDSLFLETGIHSFDINFTTTGHRTLACNLYSASGKYLGSKATDISVLNLDIGQDQIIIEGEKAILDIPVIIDNKDLVINRYIYDDTNSAKRYCDNTEANYCTIEGLELGTHEIFVKVYTDKEINEVGILKVKVLPKDTDTDMDKMPDIWEHQYAPELNASKDDANEDIDGDGVSNYQEYIDGTNPTSIFDYLLLSTPTNLTAVATPTNITLRWNPVNDAIAYSICMAEESIPDESICEDNKNGKLIGVTSNDTLIYNDLSSDNNFFDAEIYQEKVLTNNLVADTNYYFRIKALDRAGHKSLRSNEVNTTLLNEPNTIGLGGDTSKEESKSTVFPIFRTGDETLIDTMKCITDTTMTISNTLTSVRVEIPSYNEIQAFDLACTAYNVDGVEIASDVITIQVTSAVQPTDISNLNNKTLIEPTGWNAEIKIDTLAENQKSATIDFPIFSCGGDLTYLSIDDGGYLFDQDITYGSCTQGCQIWIKLDGTEYKEICPNNLYIGVLEEKVATLPIIDEDDNTTDTARLLENTLEGKIGVVEDIDYYKVIVTQSGEMKFYVSGISNNRVILYDSKGKQINCTYGCSSSETEPIIFYADEGEYYIKVYMLNDDIGDYNITSSVSSVGNFSRNALGIVKNLTTNLKWQDYYGYELKADYEVGGITGVLPYYWKDVNSYCEELNLDGIGWRVPTVEELESIVDKSQSSPTVDRAFRFTVSGFYWSSTTTDEDDNVIRSVDFYSGNTGYSEKLNIPSSTDFLQVTFNGDKEYVRCVRD